MRARRTRPNSPSPVWPRIAACALLVAPLPSCTKSQPGTNVALADGQSGGAPGASREPQDPHGRDLQHGPIEKIQINASATGVGDMLDAGSSLINMWSPPEPGATPVELRSFIAVSLIQQGFGPGFFESIDLDGVHATQIGFPHEGQPGVTERDVDVAVSLAAINPVRAIESMPAAMQPQPLGDNLWQVVEDDMELLFRAGQGALEVGLNMESLDLAHSLPATVKTNDPRLQVSATNIPSVDIDVSELLGIPGGLGRTLSEIINDAKAVSLALDFGSDRDLIARAGAQAPFGRLGLDPIGPATQQPSNLAKALPAAAMFTWVMPWGDPKLLHQVLDKQIPVNQIPAPFDSYVGEVLAGAHTLLGTVKHEVISAAYVDKGKFTLVLGAEVEDENAAREAMRKVFGSAQKAFQDHIALAGNSPDHKYSVSFKQGVSMGKAKGDVFTLTIPKAKQADLDGAGWLVGDKKPQLEVAVVVANGKMFMAFGAGQKALMGQIGKRLAKAPDDGLESGGGLALARKLAGGCQYCVAIDPMELGEMIFTVLSTDTDEPEQVRAAAKKAVGDLAKLELDGELALALRLDQQEGMLGFGWPKSLLFADPAQIKALVALFDALEEAEQQAWEAEVPSKIQ